MIRNYLSLIGSQILSRLISFFWVIYLARSLGPSDYGRYGTVLSVVAILTTLIDFGVYFVLIREIGLDREKAPRLIGFQIVQRLLVAVACSLLMMGFVWKQGYSEEYVWLFALAALHMTAQALATIGDTVFAVVGRQIWTAALNMAQAASWALLGFTVLHFGGDLRVLFGAMALNSILFLTLYWKCMNRFVLPRFEFSREEALQILRWSLPVGLTGLFGVIFDRADRILLAWLHEASDMAYYNAVMTLLTPLTDMVWSASIIILYPYMPRLHQHYDNFIRVFRSVLTWLIALFLPIVASAIVFSSPIIHLVFGQRFEPSGVIMATVAPYMLFVPFQGLMGRILIVQNRQALYGWVNFIAMLINLTLNLWWIPRYGPLACAVATVSTQFSLVILYLLVGRIDLRPFIDWKRMAILLLPLGLAVGVTSLIPTWPVLLRIALLVALYAPLAARVLRLPAAWYEVREMVRA